MPARIFSSSPVRWLTVPLPAVAKVSVPGLARASAMNSFKSRAGTDGCTTSTCGLPATSATGSRSLRVSKLSLPLYSVGLVARLLVCISRV